MEAWWKAVVAVAIALALSLGGCTNRGQRDLLPVGTCVRVSDESAVVTVACIEPHTYKVIAQRRQAEACPIDTDMYAQTADSDDGLTTECFQSDPATE